MGNNRKGFIVPLLIIIIALVVIGAGIYLYLNATQKTSSSSASAPAVTIDQSSLSSASGDPTITGTSTNISSLEISIMGGGGQYIHWISKIPVINSAWSVTVSPALNNATYLVNIIDPNTSKTLATGILTISN